MEEAGAPEELIIVLMTVPDAETGARIGRAVVEEALAACVNVIPGLRSIYRWEGAVQEDAEALCLLKTRRALYPPLRARLEVLHPYEVPEIIGVAAAEGNGPYLAWAFAQVSR